MPHDTAKKECMQAIPVQCLVHRSATETASILAALFMPSWQVLTCTPKALPVPGGRKPSASSTSLCTHTCTHSQKEGSGQKQSQQIYKLYRVARDCVPERMFAEGLTSSSFCLRVSAVRSTASQNLHLVPFPLPHPHPAPQKQIVPHDLDNIRFGQPLDMFPLWPVKALPEHSSSLIWVPRQSGPGGSRSREGVRKRGQDVR